MAQDMARLPVESKDVFTETKDALAIGFLTPLEEKQYAPLRLNGASGANGGKGRQAGCLPSQWLYA